MTKIKKLLSTIIDENVIIVTAGKKPNWILFHGKLSRAEYKQLMDDNPRWIKLEITHIASDGITLRILVKKIKL